MIYALLLKHIGFVNPPEPIRAELRPPALDCRNPHLNGEYCWRLKIMFDVPAQSPLQRATDGRPRREPGEKE
jgi:hypothetical protein